MAMNPLHSSPDDSRAEKRIVLRVSASLFFKDAPPQIGKTIDVGERGVALLMPEAAMPGTECGVRFSAMINGQAVKVEAVARVVYSICVGTAGFRIGCQFVNPDATVRAAVARIIGGR